MMITMKKHDFNKILGVIIDISEHHDVSYANETLNKYYRILSAKCLVESYS